MKTTLIAFCFVAANLMIAQTGPGGVGSSATNVLWFDANKGVTIAGGGVDQWADQSGNSKVATANGASARPSFVASAVNGFPTFDFDGTNDELWVPDDATLDLTTWHFFMLVKPDVAKSYNAWMVKGNDGQENFEILSYNTNNIHTPIYFTDATRGAPSTGNNVISTANFAIVEYSYSSAIGRDVYVNGNNQFTDNVNKTPQVNNFSLYIGNEKATAGRFVDGDISEVVAYNTVLNSVQRIIVNNYLSAKYDIALGSNDIYTMDNSGNGNFDFEVAGIGRVNASNIQNDAQGTGIVKINNPSGLGDGEYLIWGHDNVSVNANNVTDVPVGVQARMSRMWRASEVGEVGNIDISIDLAGLGSVTASDLCILIDTDNDGVLTDETPTFGAVLVGGTVYRWSGIDIDDAQRFSFGTSNSAATPMPIELTEFYAQPESSTIVLNWITATEINNNRFEIERSKDGVVFEKIGNVSSKAQGGNSTSNLNYNFIDDTPLSGISYYRLKQIDHDGKFEYHSIISVDREESKNIKFVVFPNPNLGEFSVDFSGIENNHDVMIEMYSMDGKLVYKQQYVSESTATNTVHIIPKEKIVSGQYIINFIVEGIKYPVKVIVN